MSATDLTEHMSIPIVIIAFLGCITNTISIIVLTRPSLKLSTYVYLTFMSVTDLCASFASFLTYSSKALVLLKRSMGESDELNYNTLLLLNDTTNHSSEAVQYESVISDKLISVFRNISCYSTPFALTLQCVSVWITLAFTTDRYIKISRPYLSRHFCTRQRAALILSVIYIIALCYLIPQLFEYHIEKIAIKINDKEIVEEFVSRTEFGNNKHFQMFMMAFYTLCVAFIPFITISIMNVCLMKITLKKRQSIELTQINSTHFQQIINQNKGDSIKMSCPKIIWKLPKDVDSENYQLLNTNEIDQKKWNSLSRKVSNGLIRVQSSINLLRGVLISKRLNRARIRTNDLNIMLISVIFAFLVFTWPSAFSQTFFTIFDPKKYFNHQTILFMTDSANLFMVINSFINFFLYIAFGKRFRKEFYLHFCSCWLKRYYRTKYSFVFDNNNDLNRQPNNYSRFFNNNNNNNNKRNRLLNEDDINGLSSISRIFSFFKKRETMSTTTKMSSMHLETEMEHETTNSTPISSLLSNRNSKNKNERRHSIFSLFVGRLSFDRTNIDHNNYRNSRRHSQHHQSTSAREMYNILRRKSQYFSYSDILKYYELKERQSDDHIRHKKRQSEGNLPKPEFTGNLHLTDIPSFINSETEENIPYEDELSRRTEMETLKPTLNGNENIVINYQNVPINSKKLITDHTEQNNNFVNFEEETNNVPKKCRRKFSDIFIIKIVEYLLPRWLLRPSLSNDCSLQT
ncbi:hypothetical protein SNEBB_002902 [Seison nebaliae]|nr:hypothetical protein SNEBB_002902 [Seison nebaliae]